MSSAYRAQIFSSVYIPNVKTFMFSDINFKKKNDQNYFLKMFKNFVMVQISILFNLLIQCLVKMDPFIYEALLLTFPCGYN